MQILSSLELRDPDRSRLLSLRLEVLTGVPGCTSLQFWNLAVWLLLQRDQSRSHYGTLYLELNQVGCQQHYADLTRFNSHLLNSFFVKNLLIFQFAFKVFCSNSFESAKHKRWEIFAKMKKTGFQNLEVENERLDQSCFEAEKTGNEYLYQLDPLLNLLQSGLAHSNIDQLFSNKIWNNSFF